MASNLRVNKLQSDMNVLDFSAIGRVGGPIFYPPTYSGRGIKCWSLQLLFRNTILSRQCPVRLLLAVGLSGHSLGPTYFCMPGWYGGGLRFLMRLVLLVRMGSLMLAGMCLQVRKEPKEVAAEKKEEARAANAVARKEQQEQNDAKKRMKGKNKPSRRQRKKQLNIIEERTGGGTVFI